MRLSAKDKRTMEAGLKAFLQQSALNRKLQQKLQEESLRQNAIASKYRERIFKKAFKAAGIDQAEIAKRQDANDEASLKRLKQLKPGITKNVKLTKKRQSSFIDVLKQNTESGLFARFPHNHSSPGPGGPGSPAPELYILDTASSISIPDNGGIGTTTSIKPWYNLLETSVQTTGLESRTLLACWTFTFTPDRSGVVHGWVYLLPNGSFSWRTKSTCWDDAIATYQVTAQASFQQMSPSGILNQVLVGGAGVPNIAVGGPNYGMDDHCRGASGFTPINDTTVYETTYAELPVVGGVQVQVIVQVYMNVSGQNSTGNLDFSSSGQEFNVPAVIINLY